MKRRLEIENYLNKFAKRIYFRKNDMFMKRSMIQKAFSVFEKRVRKVSPRSIGNWWKYAAVLLFPILVVGSWKLMHETEQVFYSSFVCCTNSAGMFASRVGFG